MIVRLRRSQKGFTLLEVMLVVIIIGIIALIALPRLLVTRERARDEACDSNVQAIRTQLEQYYWSFAHFPTVGITDFMTNAPEFWPSDSSVSDTCPSGGTYDSLNAYDPNTGSLVCPRHSNEPTSWL